MNKILILKLNHRYHPKKPENKSEALFFCFLKKALTQKPKQQMKPSQRDEKPSWPMTSVRVRHSAARAPARFMAAASPRARPTAACRCCRRRTRSPAGGPSEQAADLESRRHGHFQSVARTETRDQRGARMTESRWGLRQMRNIKGPVRRILTGSKKQTPVIVFSLILCYFLDCFSFDLLFILYVFFFSVSF